MESNKTETRNCDSSETPSISDTGRESQKRCLSIPDNEDLMQHKKFRDSTDEDDIKVLNSDYTRSLDEGMNRKDPEQQCHTQAEDRTEQNVEY